MRKTALLAGLVLSVPIFMAASPHASAEPLQVVFGETANITNTKKTLEVISAEMVKEQKEQPAQQAPQPKPAEHVVAAGETLTSIANAHQTTWQRLFAKNLQVANPDVINVGDKLVIPTADEVLAERALPTPPAPAPSPAPQVKPRSAAPAPKAAKPAPKPSVARGSSSGNTYTAGYCTWYVKNKRPDLPNNLGNAYTWVERARAQGLPTGSAPRVGAAGQRGNHVVYVESVNGDGTVTISEMNHAGLYVVTVRTLPASYFTYIY